MAILDDSDKPDEFTVDPGNEPTTVNVPYEPPAAATEPIMRAPDGTETPWPSDPERPEEVHLENEPPRVEPEETPEAP